MLWREARCKRGKSARRVSLKLFFVQLATFQVVAGLEPEKTNLFLQSLGRCASDESLDFAAAVRMALGGVTPSPSNVPRIRVVEAKETKEIKMEPKGGRFSNDVPPASRSSSRKLGSGSKDNEPPSRQGGMGISMGLSGLDEQIEACDGLPSTTRALLEPLITRPKLSDKLLGKPPFRFLHDVISEVIQRTSFASGLYSVSESESSNVTDKDAKIKYLEKMVKLVGMQLNTIIEARPAKIVSGLEPNNTNRLLQLLAIAASSVPDSARAVQAVLTSEEAGNGDVPTSAKSKPTEITSHTPLQETTEAKPRTTGAKEGEGDKNVELVFQDAVARTSGPPQSKDPRPTTARRRPPKYKAKNANDEQEGLKANENSLNVKQAIMIDNEDDDAADDENEDMSGGGSAINTADILTMDGKSKLVRQIQEEERSATKTGEKEGNTKEGIRFGRIDHAVATCKSKLPEANFLELQRSIQILCQSTNPLGKCMDFVHEDLFAMMKEYDKWKHDYKKCILDLEIEFRETKEVTKPLEVKLREFDDKVLDAQRCMRSIKARVLKQEERITELLRVSSVSTLQE